MKINSKNRNLIIFSHGLGVLKDNRGLFTHLDNTLQPLGFDTIMFDYNDIDKKNNEVTVKPFSEQAKLLQHRIDRAIKENSDREIIIIGQSQGSLIPTLCNVSGIKLVIAISPFFHTSKNDVLRRYTAKKENIVDFTGVSRRARSDGTTTIIPAAYWTERFKTNVEGLYNSLAQNTQLTIVNALQDEIMEFTNLKKIKYARIINTDGDHDFTHEYREILTEIIIRELGDFDGRE